MDEPTSFLDPNYKVEVFRLLKEISRSIPVVISSHEVELALRFCDKVYYISPSGELRELGSEEEINRVYRMEHAFFSPVTGTFEIKLPVGEPRTHIIGGCGSALAVVRRLGLYEPLSVGPVYPNDIDNILLSRMGANVLTCTSDEASEDLVAYVSNARRVIATRVPDYCRPKAASSLVSELRKRGVEVEFYDISGLV
jgi:energy-coupling factor transporter ATP-binding protein EcfA2